MSLMNQIAIFLKKVGNNVAFGDYYIFLYDLKNQRSIMSFSRPIRVSANRVSYDRSGDNYTSENN